MMPVSGSVARPSSAPPSRSRQAARSVGLPRTPTPQWATASERRGTSCSSDAASRSPGVVGSSDVHQIQTVSALHWGRPMSQPKPPPIALRRALEAFVDAFRDEVPEDRRSILPRGPGHLRKGELLESQIDGVGTDIIPIYVSHEVRLALATEIFEMPAGQAYSLPEEVQGVL